MEMSAVVWDEDSFICSAVAHGQSTLNQTLVEGDFGDDSSWEDVLINRESRNAAKLVKPCSVGVNERTYQWLHLMLSYDTTLTQSSY